MAKFGINDIVDVKSMISGTEKVSEYKEIWLSPYEVKPSEGNFYSQEKIEELADSFLAVGQQQPSVLARIDGEFIIVSGHRRNLANILNIERGYKEYEKVRYLYKDMTPAVLELSLLTGNIYNRELTAWERTQQAQRFKEALVRAKKEDGLEIKGSMRDIVADLMNESSSNVAKMDSINKHASPEIKEELKKGNLGITAAYEAAKLPPERQKEIAAKSAESGSVSIKEITGETKTENPYSKALEGNKLFETNIGMSIADKEKSAREEKRELQIQKSQNKRKDKSVKEELADTYTRLVEEWIGNHTGNMTKTVETAIQKVFESNIPQKDWTDTEWAVFVAGAIMRKADCVRREDLSLMKEILMRCRKAA
ncbi:hypothetical protein C818_00236 [Lachnospiraceae bacterium MD308]|nr:hypothetical protein C818_00236 [Lachnospiraceae bacterium MD308]